MNREGIQSGQNMKYVIAFVLFLLTISPLDCIPDVIPVLGWIDDVAYVVGAISALRSDRAEGK